MRLVEINILLLTEVLFYWTIKKLNPPVVLYDPRFGRLHTSIKITKPNSLYCTWRGWQIFILWSVWWQLKWEYNRRCGFYVGLWYSSFIIPVWHGFVQLYTSWQFENPAKYKQAYALLFKWMNIYMYLYLYISCGRFNWINGFILYILLWVRLKMAVLHHYSTLLFISIFLCSFPALVFSHVLPLSLSLSLSLVSLTPIHRFVEQNMRKKISTPIISYILF